jgi:hypothetical protein
MTITRLLIPLCLVAVLLGGMSSLSAADSIDLGTDQVPGLIVQAQQLGLWAAGGTVVLTVAATSDEDASAITRSVDVRSGAPGLDEAEWSAAASGTTGQAINITVTEAMAAHTTLYVTLRDGTGNTMTSRFVMVR